MGTTTSTTNAPATTSTTNLPPGCYRNRMVKDTRVVAAFTLEPEFESEESKIAECRKTCQSNSYAHECRSIRLNSTNRCYLLSSEVSDNNSMEGNDIVCDKEADGITTVSLHLWTHAPSVYQKIGARIRATAHDGCPFFVVAMRANPLLLCTQFFNHEGTAPLYLFPHVRTRYWRFSVSELVIVTPPCYLFIVLPRVTRFLVELNLIFFCFVSIVRLIHN
jgi:hypothetical protein